MNFLRLWRDFRRWQQEQLLDDEYQQIRGPALAGVLERPQKQEGRIYEIRQTHEVSLKVRVKTQEELDFWDKAIAISLETQEGELIRSTNPAIVGIECYREKPSEIIRVDGVNRDTSHPPIVRKIVEEVHADSQEIRIGIRAHSRGREYIYCIRCEDAVLHNQDISHSWYILQNETNDGGYYTCYHCKKTFL